MVNLRSQGSPNGEIDTRAPFKSVKAAISLFGEVAVFNEKHMRTRSSEVMRLRCKFSIEVAGIKTQKHGNIFIHF